MPMVLDGWLVTRSVALHAIPVADRRGGAVGRARGAAKNGHGTKPRGRGRVSDRLWVAESEENRIAKPNMSGVRIQGWELVVGS